MASKSEANITVIPSQKLSYLNTTNTNNLFQTLEPYARNIDTESSTNPQVSKDVFSYANSRHYLNLRIMKRDIINVTLRQKLVNGASQPALINDYNWFFDPFCQSKAIREFNMKWGNSQITESEDDRSPELTEIKSTMFDLEECNRWGQVPIEMSGMGHYGTRTSTGPLARNQFYNQTNAQIAAQYPLNDMDIASQTEVTEHIRNLRNSKRVRCLNDSSKAPLMKMDNNNGNVLTPEWCPALNAWVPADNTHSNAIPPVYSVQQSAYYKDKNDNGIRVYYGTVYAEYQFEVKEYIISQYLTTPYSKNKTERMIKVDPSSNVIFNISYNNDYITNGMFKWITGDTYETQNNLSCDVSRDINQGSSTITLESLSVMTPPSSDYDLQFITYKPTKVTADPKYDISPTGGPVEIITNNKESQILPQYIFIGGDYKFFTGDQNNKLKAGQVATFNTSTFNFSNVTDCNISVGQINLTQNLGIDDLRRMTNDLISNPTISENILGIKELKNYLPSGPQYSKYGCPFLFLELSKLNCGSFERVQLMPNVDYQSMQNIQIKFKLQPQNDFRSPVTTTFTLYPLIYFFSPYGISQKAGQAISAPTQLYMNEGDALKAINEKYNGTLDYDLNILTGAGFFDDAKQYIKDNGKSMMSALMKGIRLGEKFLSSDEKLADEYKITHAALKGLDNLGKSVGIGHSGRKGGAIRQ